MKAKSKSMPHSWTAIGISSESQQHPLNTAKKISGTQMKYRNFLCFFYTQGIRKFRNGYFGAEL
jgi:hypothetical protein